MLSPSELDQYNAIFQEASAQGQTLVAAAGDDGSTACARYSSAQGVTAAEQQELSVDFPASSPNVTAVGGTQMAPGTFTAGNSPYWFSASSVDTTNSLRSYVPEVVWNEGSPSHGIVAGGGGSSVHFPRPAWQSAFSGMPVGTNRVLPGYRPAVFHCQYRLGLRVCRAHERRHFPDPQSAYSRRTARPGAHWSGTATTGVYACALICGCLVGSQRKWRLTLLLRGPIPFTRRPNPIGCGGGANNSTSPLSNNTQRNDLYRYFVRHRFREQCCYSLNDFHANSGLTLALGRLKPDV